MRGSSNSISSWIYLDQLARVLNIHKLNLRLVIFLSQELPLNLENEHWHDTVSK